MSGEPGKHTGWVIDYADIGTVVNPLIDTLDHHYLNEIPGLENPTSEVIAVWIWDRLISDLPGLARVVVCETCNCSCIYEGG